LQSSETNVVKAIIGPSKTYNDLFPFQFVFPDLLSQFLLYFVSLALGSRQSNLTDVVVNADMWPRRGSNRQNSWQ